MIKYIIAVFYLIDLFLNFHLAYYQNGELITEKNKIIKKYLQRDFYLDLISLLVYMLCISQLYTLNSYENYLMWIYFIKFVKVKQIFHNIEELLVVDENYYHFYSLFILLVRIFIISHLAACIWHLLGISYDNSWLKNSKELINNPWEVRYLYSIYFILITMNTVGYGDISPVNSPEMIFTIFFVIIGCFMFAYSLNCMGTIFHALNKKEREFKEELFLINGFMRSKNIPQNIQIRIRKYLEHTWIAEKQQSLENAKKVFNKLSESLKSELLLEANGSIVNKIDVFSSNFTEKTLHGIVKIMKEENYSPGEIIFQAGDYRNKDLFFIKKGNVEIFVQNDLNEKNEGKSLKSLKEGNIFGEVAFFSEMPRTASCKSKEFTTLIRFDQNEFKQIIEENDEDKEQYHHIMDMIKFYQNYDGLLLKCYSCNKRNHMIINCPLLHRVFFKDVCLKKYNYSINQTRQYYERSHEKNKLFYEKKRSYAIEQKIFKILENNVSENEKDPNTDSSEEECTYKEPSSHPVGSSSEAIEFFPNFKNLTKIPLGNGTSMKSIESIKTHQKLIERTASSSSYKLIEGNIFLLIYINFN